MLAQSVLSGCFDPLDAVAPYEALCAGGALAGEDALSLRATGRLDPHRAGPVVVPGASGRIGGDAGEAEGGAAADTVQARLGRALETDSAALPLADRDNRETTAVTVCGDSADALR